MGETRNTHVYLNLQSYKILVRKSAGRRLLQRSKYRPIWWDNIKMYIRDVDMSLCPVFSAGPVTAVVNNEKLSKSLQQMYS
jgi:hypothetical protein